MYAAVSLAEDHDATVDEYADATIDKTVFGGHVYLDKAPGMTLLALPAVAFADVITGERATLLVKTYDDPGFARFLRLRTRLAVATGPALLTALAAVLLYDLALGLTASTGAALFASLGYALGTPAWGWSTTLFGHAPVAALYVIAVWAVWAWHVRRRIATGHGASGGSGTRLGGRHRISGGASRQYDRDLGLVSHGTAH